MKKSFLTLGAILAFGIASAQVNNGGTTMPQSQNQTTNNLKAKDNTNRSLSTGVNGEQTAAPGTVQPADMGPTPLPPSSISGGQAGNPGVNSTPASGGVPATTATPASVTNGTVNSDTATPVKRATRTATSDSKKTTKKN
ncbi:MAG: hypothetical protein EOO45_07030 [Flavobacterium sp.]|nr:MAG: hypothetical protein EOO45_07030 [Flavobacterium sp.]